tara:strand:- start:5004 stop:5240 length:237 start_codon:yes stop_codon:yes gene_type:complete
MGQKIVVGAGLSKTMTQLPQPLLLVPPPLNQVLLTSQSPSLIQTLRKILVIRVGKIKVMTALLRGRNTHGGMVRVLIE